MTLDPSSWLPGLVGPIELQANGVDVTAPRSTWNFVGIEISDAGNDTLTFTANTGAKGVVTLEGFGAVGNGTADDSAAMTAAIAAISGGGTIQLGAGSTYNIGTGAPYTLPANSSIVGFGDTSVLKTASNTSVLIALNAACNLLNFKIIGNGGTASQVGVQVGDPSVVGSCPIDFRASGVYAYNLGWGFTINSNLSVLGKGPAIVGCTAQNNAVGGFNCHEGEYTTFSGCRAIDNNPGSLSVVGLNVAAGNVTWSGGDIGHNGVGVFIRNSGNNGHGLVVGANINHNAQCVSAETGVTAGFSFVGCHLYGSDLWLFGCTGLVFRGCVLECPDMVFQGSTATQFDGCTFANTSPPSLFNSYLGNASTTFWMPNCMDLTGAFPSWITGNAYVLPIPNSTVVATGGSAAATLPAAAIGGTGQPTTAAQNGWIRLFDSTGATVWVPTWK